MLTSPWKKSSRRILLLNIPVAVMLFNVLLFGKRFFTDPQVLVVSGVVVLLTLVTAWLCFYWLAKTVRQRLPSGRNFIKRVGITIGLIAILQALFTTIIFQGYEHFHLLGYQLNEGNYTAALIVGFFINVLSCVVEEGVENFEGWKATMTETEQLKKIYTQSQLLGLRSQINPHFLFNSLNSLSSLISEDEEKAEQFLNELTKVYRYLLRGSEEQLVTLKTELQFIASYYYLLRARYGESIQLDVSVTEEAAAKMVTPLLLQTVFEYSFNANTLSKDSPLRFTIAQDGEGWLYVANNIQHKQAHTNDSNMAFSNLREKYKLLGNKEIIATNNGNMNIVRIPLLEEYVMSNAS